MPSSKIDMAISKGFLSNNGRNKMSNNIDPSKVNPMRTSHPLLVKSGVFKVSKKSKINKNQMSLSRESTFQTESDGIPNKSIGVLQPPMTLSYTTLKQPGVPTAMDKMAGVHTMSTLTTKTSTDTDITASVHTISEFQQISAPDRCFVIGCPCLPQK